MKKLFASRLDPSLQGKEYTINRRKVVVEDAIAEGGFSIVFLVSCEAENTKYALKRMFVNSKDSLNQCMQEIKISLKLSGHKNTVRIVDTTVLDVGNGVNEVLILMNFYPGSVLGEMNQRLSGGFSEEEVLRTFGDVCEAVALMHSLEPPVIHRDLKVENLLRDSLGNCVLCDFGSATTMALDPQVHGFNHVADEIQKHTTPAYRSPEMVDLFGNRPITTKSDIWALGCLLYRLCFFTNCFGDGALAVSSGNFTVPDHHPYSEGLVKLIGYMLEVDADSRPDIFQVSHLAFKMSNRPCPVPNRKNSPVPNISDLPLPQTESSARLARPTTINRVLDQQDQVSGTSINPRERPRGQMVGRAQGFNLHPPVSAVGLAAPSGSPPGNHFVKAKVEATPSRPNPFYDPSPAPPTDFSLGMNSDWSGPAISDDKPLIDFSSPRVDSIFDCQTQSVPYQPPPVPQQRNPWSRPPHPPTHYRTLSGCQATYSMTPPFVGRPTLMMPLSVTESSWNQFQAIPVGPRPGNAGSLSFDPSVGQRDPTSPWHLQSLASKHRRNMSDTSALFSARHPTPQVDGRTGGNLNSNSVRPPTWHDRSRQQILQPQYASARQLQQVPGNDNDNDVDVSLVRRFDDLALRHSRSTAPLVSLDQSASSRSLPGQSAAGHRLSSTRSLAGSQSAGVDAFGAVPFHSMVSELKRKHPEMCHKRSASEI